MNPLFISVAILSVLGFATASNHRDSRKSEIVRNEDTAICTRELEGIVYQPESAALNYLNRIGDQIRLASPILWTSVESSFLESLEARYGITITVLSPFRDVTFPASEVGTAPFYKSTTSTANMNGNGFARDTDSDQTIDYEIVVFNQNGEMKYVMINMPLENAPMLKQ